MSTADRAGLSHPHCGVPGLTHFRPQLYDGNEDDDGPSTSPPAPTPLFLNSPALTFVPIIPSLVSAHKERRPLLTIHGNKKVLQGHLIHDHGFIEGKWESQRIKAITNDDTVL